jgi:hypothetical protein
MIPLKIVEKIVSKAIPVSIIHLEKIKWFNFIIRKVHILAIYKILLNLKRKKILNQTVKTQHLLFLRSQEIKAKQSPKHKIGVEEVLEIKQ